MSETKSFHVNSTLSLARFTARFYPLVYGLSGRAATYQNPGESVFSYLVARALKQEIVELEEHLCTSLKQCEIFCTDRTILMQINDKLTNQASQLVNTMNTLNQDQRVRLIPAVQELHELGQLIRLTFDSLLTVQVPGAERLELDSVPGTTYRQSVFDMQTKLEYWTSIIEQFETPTPSVA